MDLLRHRSEQIEPFEPLWICNKKKHQLYWLVQRRSLSMASRINGNKLPHTPRNNPEDSFWKRAFKAGALGLLILSGQASAATPSGGYKLTPNGNPLVSLDEFAAISHTLKYPYHSTTCFERDELFNYFYSPDRDYRSTCDDGYDRDKIKCDSFQSPYGQEKMVALVKPKNELVPISDHDECLLLQDRILRSHVDLALNGQLDDRSQYGPHRVVVCLKDDCAGAGDLTALNKASKEVREHLSQEPRKICPFIGSEKTVISTSFYQSISATVFGRVPERIKDICFKLFGDFTKLDSGVLDVMQEILNNR